MPPDKPQLPYFNPLITHTNSMQQSRIWDAHLVNKFPILYGSLCLPSLRISAMCRILSQLNPVHSLTPCLYNINFNIIHLLLGLASGLFLQVFFYKHFLRIFLMRPARLFHVLHLDSITLITSAACKLRRCEFSGSHGGEYEDDSLQGYGTH
jgi:hypothetical protein